MSDLEEGIQVVVLDEQIAEQDQALPAEESDNDDYLALVDSVFSASPTTTTAITTTAIPTSSSIQSDEEVARAMQKEEMRLAKARAQSGSTTSRQSAATSRAPNTTSGNSKSKDGKSSAAVSASISASASVSSTSDVASTTTTTTKAIGTAKSDEGIARAMQKQELRRAKARAKASSKSDQSRASSSGGYSIEKQKKSERRIKRGKSKTPQERTGTNAPATRSRNIELAVTTVASSSSSHAPSGRSGTSSSSGSHGSPRSPYKHQHRRPRQRGESNHSQQKNPSNKSSNAYPLVEQPQQSQPTDSVKSTEETDAAFARALQEEETRQASAAVRPPAGQAAAAYKMDSGGKPVPSSSDDVAFARALQNQEIRTSRQQHAQQRDIIREHLRVRTRVGEGTRWERAVKYVKKKTEAAKDSVNDVMFSDGTAGNCCRNFSMLFTPVRLRTDSETARDMDRRFNQENEGSYSGMSAADRRLAERQQRQQIQRDEEIAMQIHGREVEHVENDMLQHQYGDGVQGNLDFMRSTEHYPYFCRGMSIFLTFMLIVEIIYNGGFETVAVNAALGPSVDTMVALGAKKKDLILQGQIHRLVTPMFLHAGVLHLLFNLLGLNNIGAPAEREYGSKKIAIIYFSAGIFAVTVSAIFIPNVVSVGASGAIFALFGACWSDLIQNWTLYRGNACKVLLQLSFMTILNMVIGLVPFIDNFQHLGGMFAGFFLGLALLVHPRYSISGRQKSAKDYQVTLRYFSMIFVPVIIIVALVVLFTVPNALVDCPGCAYLSCIPLPPGVPKEELWWDCDPCSVGGIAQSQLFRNGTLSVTCPRGTFNEDDVAAADAVVRTLRVCQQFCQD